MEFVEERAGLTLEPELTGIDELIVEGEAVMLLVVLVEVIDPILRALHRINGTGHEVMNLWLLNRLYTIDVDFVKVCTIESTEIGPGGLDCSPVDIQTIVLDVRVVT